MKAQIRMIIASVIIIALALTAVSGITYSWFSDTEQSDITITTAKVDYTVDWQTSGNNDNGTAWTIANGDVTITGLAAKAVIPVINSITNNSTIKTVYKISATAKLAEDHNYTLYDLKNIYVGGTQLNASSDDGETITLGETVIVDWTTLNVGSNPEKQTVSVTTPQSYGGETADKKIVAYNPTTGEGSITKDDTTYTADWTQTVRKGLTITLSVVAAQGDYPYEELTQDEGVKTVSANMPANKVLKASSITSSGDDGKTVTDVIVDLSDVQGTEGTTDVSGTKLTVGITSVNETAKQVTVNLSLTDVSTGDAISNPTFDNPVVVTMTVPGKLTNPTVLYDGIGIGGTVLSSTINSTDGTTTIVFSVMHFSNYKIMDSTIVTTAEDLQQKLTTGGLVKLGTDIIVAENLDFQTAGEYIIDLDQHTLNITGALVGYNGCKDHSTACDKANAADVQGVSLEIRNGKLVTNTTGATAAFKVGVGSSLKLDSVDYDAQTGSAIFPRGNSANVIVNDSTITAGCYGIGTNASTSDNYNVVIKISGSAIATSSTDYDNTAVMINVKGILYIYDSELKADRQCLIVRAGTAQIYDTKMIYTGKFKADSTETAWGDGNNVAKAAIVVGNMTQTSYYDWAWIFVKGVEVVGEDGKALDSELRALLLAKYMTGYSAMVQMNANSVCSTIQESTYIENADTGVISKYKSDWTGSLS